MNQISAQITTNKGTITVNLFADKVPYTVAHFVNLVQRGYYNGLKFHRVIADFMVQGGCPYGSGTGGPGYNFADEFSAELKHDRPGILSMANAGPNTNGSQFFITHIPTPWLDRKHSIFGAVAGPADQEVVDSLRQGDIINAITISGDPTELFEQTADKLQEWNVMLDKRFPRRS
jgi:peptidyl-prolyl cis-trans isomerase B (cyclophilin B)